MTAIVRLLDEESVCRRNGAISARLYAPLRQSVGFSVIIGAIGLIAGLLFARSGSPDGAIGVAAAAIALEVIPWAWLRHADSRAALELVMDHDRYERSEWRRDTGTKRPSNLKRLRAWSEGHPSGPGRASALLRLGRLEEADRAIALMPSSTPDEAFARDILLATRILFAGARPPVADLHASWRLLQDPVERRHLRECLALLDGQIAAAADEPVWPILAAARRDIDLILPGSRTWRLVLTWLRINFLVVLLPVVLAALVRF